jgi:hypothetical protein
MLTEEFWAAMEPNIRQGKRHTGGQPPALPDRDFF